MTNKMTDEDFAEFTDPQNHTAQILLAHFFMLDYILEANAIGPAATPFAFQKQITLAWVEKAAAKLPPRHKQCMIWPVGMVEQLKNP